MKKTITIGFIAVIFTSTVNAGTIFEKKTSNAKGGRYQNDGKTLIVAVHECRYSVTDDPYDNKNVKVYINSDEASSSNFAFTVPRSELPLRDGSTFLGGSGNDVIYKDGVLSAKRVVSDGLLVRDVDKISITVSADLSKVTSAEGLSTVGNYFLQKIKLKDIICKF